MSRRGFFRRPERGLDALKLDQHLPMFNVRSEPDHRCPDCKVKGGMLSYQLKGDPSADPKHPDMQPCGFYCGRCGWGNGGSREVNDPLAIAIDDSEVAHD